MRKISYIALEEHDKQNCADVEFLTLILHILRMKYDFSLIPSRFKLSVLTFFLVTRMGHIKSETFLCKISIYIHSAKYDRPQQNPCPQYGLSHHSPETYTIDCKYMHTPTTCDVMVILEQIRVITLSGINCLVEIASNEL